MSADGKISWVVSPRPSSMYLLSMQGDIVCLGVEADAYNVTYSAGADPILPFHVHDQSHGRNVAKSQDEIDMK